MATGDIILGNSTITGTNGALVSANEYAACTPYTPTASKYVNKIYIWLGNNHGTTVTADVGIYSISGTTHTRIAHGTVSLTSADAVLKTITLSEPVFLSTEKTYSIAFSSTTNIKVLYNNSISATSTYYGYSGYPLPSSFVQGSNFSYDFFGYATEIAVTAPTVSTQAVSGITTTGGTGNGNITATGGLSPTTRGFCYVLGTGTPTTSNSTVSDTGTFSTGAYTKAITGLTSGTRYNVRAYAINAEGTSYGSTVALTTSPVTPTVTTQAASDAAINTATLNGNITATGGENATARGFYLAAGSVTPTAADTVISASGSFGTGAYTGSATGLTPNTLYSARAFATNSAGTSTGSVIEFTTLPAPSGDINPESFTQQFTQTFSNKLSQ
jgi:hypothetical protein